MRKKENRFKREPKTDTKRKKQNSYIWLGFLQGFQGSFEYHSDIFLAILKTLVY